MHGVISVAGDPTLEPTSVPPTADPTNAPTAPPATAAPSTFPTEQPTRQPTSSESPTIEPTTGPTQEPTTASPTSGLTTVPSTAAPSLTQTAQPTPEPTAAPTGTIHVVDWGISDGDVGRFVVTLGDAVLWRWSDTAAHSVHSTDGAFTSSSIMTGAGNEYTITFNAEGTYPFECAVHPVQMKGKVVVSSTGEDTGGATREGWAPNGHVMPVALLSILMLFYGMGW